MDRTTLWEWLLECNRQGATGNRLVAVEENPRFSASSDPTTELTFYYDKGPQSATDNPWP